MSPVLITALLTLIGELISAAPGVIADIEAIIARAKAPAAPLAPQVTSDTAALAAKLEGK